LYPLTVVGDSILLKIKVSEWIQIMSEVSVKVESNTEERWFTSKRKYSLNMR